MKSLLKFKKRFLTWWEEEVVWKVEDWISEFKWSLRRIQRIFEYIPVIWNTHDYDSSFGLELLAYQLGRLEKCIKRSETWIVKRQRLHIERIQLVRKLITRYTTHYYFTEEPYNIGSSIHKHEKCRRLIFKLLERHHEEWWD